MNLFKRLHKWAFRQDENFTTECLLIVLERMLENAPQNGLALIQEMVGFNPRLRVEDVPYLEIRTQSTYDIGRPDIEIVLRDELHIMIEVKIGSAFGDRQLSRYRAQLSKCSAKSKYLVVLTKDQFDTSNERAEFADYYRRWYQIGEFLREQLYSNSISDEITRELSTQLVDFLKEQGMTSELVGWELARGVRAWQALHSMIQQALTKEGKRSETPRSSVGADWAGWYTDSKSPRVWIGITWDNPTVLKAETNGLRVDSAPNDFGIKIDNKDDPGGLRWVASLDLESEDIHFFSRSLASQKTVVEEFVGKCLKATEGLPAQ